ncbi:Reticulon [Lasallia pustulata]|nr:Reticulon [Lasallia pustulata]
MNDQAPQLGNIPQYSEMNIPTLGSNDNDTSYEAGTHQSTQDAKNTVYSNAQSAVNTVQNHPVTQNIRDTVSNGPVAETVKDQSAKTTSEFRSLADKRTAPDERAATGQRLTRYHSFFYSLLSWEHPRASALSYLAIVAFIFIARYLPALRLLFKLLSYVIGVTTVLEIVGKTVFSRGLASSFRPKKYYTIPKEVLEASVEDVEQLVNFFVIEVQRVVFAENVAVSGAAFVATFLSYWLIKFLPLWGLSLIAVSIAYLAPLIYINNKAIIDEQLHNISQVVNSQATQVKDLAGHHTARATETVKAYAGDYTSKAQNYIGSAKARATSPGASSVNTPLKSGPGDRPSYSSSDFPHAPKQEPIPGVTSHEQQYQQSQFGGQAEPAY